MVAIIQTTPVVLSKLNALYPNIAYQADVSNNVDDEKEVYFRVSERLFKERYGNHVRDSKHQR